MAFRIVLTMLLALSTTVLQFGLSQAQAVGSKDLFRCRQNCYQKFVQDWHHCMDFDDCRNMCITPPNINSYIPEAFSFLCWNNCDQQLGPFPLNINSALRQGSLVLTDIAWDQAITNASKQCLVTWEVSGGGLMGNLLTDSSTVELSLWPETVYHVQVTCKHKETGGMRRSYKLIVDTHKLSETLASGMQAIAMDTGSKSFQNVYGNDVSATASSSSSVESDSRMRILKDSSKDFLTPYNPNAGSSSESSASNNQINKDSSSSSKVIVKGNTLYRQTLTQNAPTSLLGQSSVSFVSESIVLAIMGALLLFLVVLVLIFAFTRTAAANHKDLPASSIDKEVLIHTELLPEQTAALAKSLHQQQQQQATSQSKTKASLASGMDSTNAQTLHV